MVKVAILIGGAGTGKTSELLSVMESAKTALGGDPFALGFASLTRAARAEAVSRASAAWGIPEDVLAKEGWFRTAHSVCYRQLGIEKGQVIGDSKDDRLWLAKALGVHISVISDEDTGLMRYSSSRRDEPAAVAMNCWELCRARVEPISATMKRLARAGAIVPPFAQVKQYVERYEAAKRLEGRYDFHDLLARYAGLHFTVDGFSEVDPEGPLPAGVKAWIFDESQDASTLVDRVCRRLANGPEVLWAYLAGDPFQSVFGFGGSDSAHFLGWPADKKRVMPKSWRCPKPVLDLGEKCLRRMRKGYWDRGIAPADHDGSIERAGSMDAVLSTLDPSRSTLVLARCNYTLDDWSGALRRKGMPYTHLKAKDATKATMAARTYWEMEHGEPVSAEDFANAIAATPTRDKDGPLMNRGVKAAWGRDETLRRFDVLFPGSLTDVGVTDLFISKVAAGKWADWVDNGTRWRRAAVNYGVDLATRPHIRLGSIHAAKGMEADVVVLATTTSRRVEDGQLEDPETYDEERRVEYVGVTRTREKLIVCDDIADEHKMTLPL
jgi:superfamily I DNA/RNA helicase